MSDSSKQKHLSEMAARGCREAVWMVAHEQQKIHTTQVMVLWTLALTNIFVFLYYLISYLSK